MYLVACGLRTGQRTKRRQPAAGSTARRALRGPQHSGSGSAAASRSSTSQHRTASHSISEHCIGCEWRRRTSATRRLQRRRRRQRESVRHGRRTSIGPIILRSIVEVSPGVHASFPLSSVQCLIEASCAIVTVHNGSRTSLRMYRMPKTAIN